MKRMTAWLAAFCLIATCILPVRAAETSGTDLFRTALEDTGTDSQKTEEENQSEVKAGTGITFEMFYVFKIHKISN